MLLGSSLSIYLRFSDGLTKRGAWCKKSKESANQCSLINQSLKKGHCHKGSHFLVYENKVISKVFNLGGATVEPS